MTISRTVRGTSLTIGLVLANLALAVALISSSAQEPPPPENRVCVHQGGPIPGACKCEVNTGSANTCSTDADCSANSPSVCSGGDEE
jgi:hypothetical protein